MFSLVGFLPPNMTQGFSVSWLRKGGGKLVFAAKLECLDVDFQALSTRNECVIQVMPGPPRSWTYLFFLSKMRVAPFFCLEVLQVASFSSIFPKPFQSCEDRTQWHHLHSKGHCWWCFLRVDGLMRWWNGLIGFDDFTQTCWMSWFFWGRSPFKSEPQKRQFLFLVPCLFHLFFRRWHGKSRRRGVGNRL